MNILVTPTWQDYALLDSGDGYRLEQFGAYRISRPDPQTIWKRRLSQNDWSTVDAHFQQEGNNKGQWIKKSSIPDQWSIHYNDLSFWARLTPFKHTGIFPEQATQWNWMQEKIKKTGRQINILNLFAYTGLASLACAIAGAKVTHVDASKPAIAWAKENQLASKLSDKPIRWILDDTIQFTEREIKRSVQYDGIIMDPPVYGHGPQGEVWDFNKSMPKLLENCRKILSAQPLFIIINAYAISASAIMLQNILRDFFGDLHGTIEFGELALQEQASDRLLSTGIFGKWSSV